MAGDRERFIAAGFDAATVDESAALGKGYRYRVPVSAPTTLTVYKDSSKGAFAFGPATDQKVIAQYGPIAALPSSFKGKGGHVLVKHWPDSGGLQTVEIGAEDVAAQISVGDDARGEQVEEKEAAQEPAAGEGEVVPRRRRQLLQGVRVGVEQQAHEACPHVHGVAQGVQRPVGAGPGL